MTLRTHTSPTPTPTVVTRRPQVQTDTTTTSPSQSPSNMSSRESPRLRRRSRSADCIVVPQENETPKSWVPPENPLRNRASIIASSPPNKSVRYGSPANKIGLYATVTARDKNGRLPKEKKTSAFSSSRHAVSGRLPELYVSSPSSVRLRGTPNAGTEVLSTRNKGNAVPFNWDSCPLASRKHTRVTLNGCFNKAKEFLTDLQMKKVVTEEAYQFRARMQRMIPLFKVGALSFGVTPAERRSLLLGNMLETFSVYVRFPHSFSQNTQTCVECIGKDTVESVVDRVLSMTKRGTEKSSQKVVQISGHTNLFIFDITTPLCELVYVQQCIQRRHKIEFSVLDKKDVVLPDGNPLPLPFPAPEVWGHEKLKHFEWLHDEEDLGFDVEEEQVIDASTLRKPFQLKILCVENFKPEMLSRFCDKAKAAKPDNWNYYVQTTLYNGDRLIAPAMMTEQQTSTVWAEWLNSETDICLLPLDTVMCVTFFGVYRSGAPTPLGGATIPLYSFDNVLMSGVYHIQLYPGIAGNISAPRVRNDDPDTFILVFEAERPPRPIVSLPMLIKKLERRDARHGFGIKVPKEDFDVVQATLKKNAIDPLSAQERELLWKWKEYCLSISGSTALLLSSVPWTDPRQCEKAHRLLQNLGLIDPLHAFQLLGGAYADRGVRDYAVRCLAQVSDHMLVTHMHLLVQLLKFEPHHDSALARFLLFRALRNRTLVGHHFFWALKIEAAGQHMRDRCALLLEVYLESSDEHGDEILGQLALINRLQSIADVVKSTKKERRTPLLRELLASFDSDIEQDGLTFQLPVKPSMMITGFDVNKCRCMDSNAAPLWLVFRLKDAFTTSAAFIFKSGDDLRQDILTLQAFSVMDQLWSEVGLDMHMSIYSIVSTARMSGFIEVIPNAATSSTIQKEAGGLVGALQKTPLNDWLRQHNSGPMYTEAVNNFVISCAAYSVASYIIGLGDRHNDNLMITKEGHLFHIDFAHFLGNIMKVGPYKREKGPFVFTPEFMHVMGDSQSPFYISYLNLCCISYNVLRKNANIFISLFTLMLSADIPQLQQQQDIIYLRDALALNLSEDEAAATFKSLVEISLNTFTTQVLFFTHNLAHPD
eukprot:TRINITY_DN3403_c1_g2_i6.p1 TRINITY_DN3403_c1_g2~~TRINITY_DN3403_c1_g2_i6.p1  ORF type:complete len:1194 (+),score=181.99 TRINITY_DN3403_c1_g2_i6:278-3583(+)